MPPTKPAHTSPGHLVLESDSFRVTFPAPRRRPSYRRARDHEDVPKDV